MKMFFKLFSLFSQPYNSLFPFPPGRIPTSIWSILRAKGLISAHSSKSCMYEQSVLLDYFGRI